jgi:hypothetical protein
MEDELPSLGRDPVEQVDRREGMAVNERRARSAVADVSAKGGRSRCWLRALAVWLLIAVAETVHGVLRGLLLVPAVGEALAARIGFVVGCAIVVGIAWATSRWLGAATRAAQFGVGALWAALMLGFEVLVGLARGFDMARIAAEFDPTQGGLMGFGLLLLFVAPWLGAWLRGLRPAR